MVYKFSTLKRVLDLFEGEQTWGATQISRALGKSTVIVHRYLKALVEQGKLKKVGKGAHTKYQLTTPIKGNRVEEIMSSDLGLSYQQAELLDRIFLKFGADGSLLTGVTGLITWCQTRGLDAKQKALAYIDIYEHIVSLQDDCGLLETTQAFSQNVETMCLDRVYYADQYKWMEFGRGKLAELTFYGKQSQNYELLMQSISVVKRKISCLVRREKYDAIGIVPRSIKRENQLLKILRAELETLDLPFVKIIKYYPNKIPIPQKSLKTRAQRILNAENTIFVDDMDAKTYKKVLLIDDFVGSGSTLNTTAQKLKDEGVGVVHGFAFVGNANLSYEVIREI